MYCSCPIPRTLRRLRSPAVVPAVAYGSLMVTEVVVHRHPHHDLMVLWLANTWRSSSRPAAVPCGSRLPAVISAPCRLRMAVSVSHQVIVHLGGRKEVVVVLCRAQTMQSSSSTKAMVLASDIWMIAGEHRKYSATASWHHHTLMELYLESSYQLTNQSLQRERCSGEPHPALIRPIAYLSILCTDRVKVCSNSLVAILCRDQAVVCFSLLV